MKLSAWVFLNDLIPIQHKPLKQAIIDKFSKQNIFQSFSSEYIFKSLKLSGVDGVELLIPTYSTDNDKNEAKNILQKNRMPVLSIHQSLTNLFGVSSQEIASLCEIAHEFSAKIVVVHLQSIGNKIFDKDFVNSLKSLEQQYNLSIGFENSPLSPFSIFNSYTWKETEFSNLMKKTGFN